MAGSAKTMLLFVYVAGIMFIAVASRSWVNEITCEDALTKLTPCQQYLSGSEPSPSAPCCLGVHAVKDSADTQKNRQEACVCIKKAATAPGSGINPDRAKKLPDLCKVTLPVPVEPNVDCSKIPA